MPSELLPSEHRTLKRSTTDFTRRARELDLLLRALRRLLGLLLLLLRHGDLLLASFCSPCSIGPFCAASSFPNEKLQGPTTHSRYDANTVKIMINFRAV